MVSVFEGQLARTWMFNNRGRNHVISLYHDTITGVRSAMLDFKEIRGSTGNSSLLMESKGHRIFFSVDDLPSYIEIKREGWTGFTYACIINDNRIPESTETVAIHQEVLFSAKIVETTLTPDEESSEYPITWFYVRTTRLSDKVVTHVHRRFRDFSELNSQVKQNLKGHHLRAALPPFPDKTPKAMVNYKDPDFIRDRQLKLEQYLVNLIAIPHVSDMICIKAFLGLMDQVRELSTSFHVPTLGLTLQPAASVKSGDVSNTPVVVGNIQKPELCNGVQPGDSISKINGVPISGYTFNAVVNRIKLLPRPMIIHFIQIIHGDSTLLYGETLDSTVIGKPVDMVVPAASIEDDEEWKTYKSSSNNTPTTPVGNTGQSTNSPKPAIRPLDDPFMLNSAQPAASSSSTTTASKPIANKDTSAILNKHSSELFGGNASSKNVVAKGEKKYDKSVFGDDDGDLVTLTASTTLKDPLDDTPNSPPPPAPSSPPPPVPAPAPVAASVPIGWD